MHGFNGALQFRKSLVFNFFRERMFEVREPLVMLRTGLARFPKLRRKLAIEFGASLVGFVFRLKMLFDSCEKLEMPAEERRRYPTDKRSNPDENREQHGQNIVVCCLRRD
jgi:hypothetical protein